MKHLLTAALMTLATPALAADDMTLMLDWFVNPDHAPIVLAQEKGFFADENLKVEIVAPADPADPPKLVAAGRADLAVTYQPQLHLQVHEGLPLVRVGTLVGTPLNCLMVKADGPVQNIEDLKGKKIGYSVSGVEEALHPLPDRRLGQADGPADRRVGLAAVLLEVLDDLLAHLVERSRGGHGAIVA